jgi:hypothetical protein
MVALFGPSEEDRERLRSTVHSLGTTSVPGLAAALSWRERKTEKLLAQELARPGTPLAYEPARRVVRWAKPLPVIPVPSEVAQVAPSTPELPARAPRSPPPVLSGGTLKILCPTCHVSLIPTGSASLAVCPQCGRLSTTRGANAEGGAAPNGPAPVASAPETVVSNDLQDRRSQELFAAYVSSKPIPCPKCRTPLRHRGLSEYVCPNCAQVVRFPKSVEPPAASTPPPAPPA